MGTTRKTARVELNQPMSPPHWALLQRHLFDEIAGACEAFFDHYFDSRGYLLCHPRWGALDGPDDAAENLTGWTVFHALGGSDVVLQLYRQGWEGHLQQYTEARTVEVPFARDGMYYKEFPVMFDWAHNGEGFCPFFHQGLCEPHDRAFQNRIRRFAGLYMNEDPQAPNYDAERRLIRSLINGSRGPLLRKTEPLDWVGDPVEVEHRFTPLRGERTYEDMLKHFEHHVDVVGDHPLNLATTILALNAYMVSGEEKYRDWVIEYVDAWVERTKSNDGIIPSNIGLDGSIGGECGGKWYGGVYGWAFTCSFPSVVHRAYFRQRSPYGFGNALLLTGDQGYVDLWRTMVERINENRKEIDGQTMYPHMHGDEGWYDYQPRPFDHGALEVCFWSMDDRDRKRVADEPWIAYLDGRNPDFPVQVLQRDLEAVRNRIAAMRADTGTPDTRSSEEPNAINPGDAIDGLTQLMIGGIPTQHVGGALHSRIRYFDPDRRRAGVPEDVASLVETMSDDEVTVTLVNVNQRESRTLILQGGAYGEHRIENVRVETIDRPGESVPLRPGMGYDILRTHTGPSDPGDAERGEATVGDSVLHLRLAPGAGGRLVLKMKRYANQPTLHFPW